MPNADAEKTIRSVFRTIPKGLVLRKAPTVKIDERVLRWVFGPAKSLLKNRTTSGQEQPKPPITKKK